MCYRGIGLQKVALESPDKWYIPFEHYDRVTTSLCDKLSIARQELLNAENSRECWRSVAVLGIAVLLVLLVLK